MFHDDVLSANGVRGVVAPVKNLRHRHCRVRLDWKARDSLVAGFRRGGGLALTICDGGYFRVGSHPSWSRNGRGYPRDNALFIIAREDECSIVSPFIFLVRCNGRSART